MRVQPWEEGLGCTGAVPVEEVDGAVGMAVGEEDAEEETEEVVEEEEAVVDVRLGRDRYRLPLDRHVVSV